MFKYLEETLFITVASLRPPNRQNKKRKQRRAVERFEGKVISLVDQELQKNHLNKFHNPKSRQTYAEKIVKTKIIEKEVEYYQNKNDLSWNNFKVDKKKKIDILTFTRKRIKYDTASVLITRA